MSAFIIVIDDSATIRKIIEIALQREGYKVICFQNAVEAIQWLSGPQANVPDLIFVDLSMPQISGYDFIRWLKSKPAFQQIACVIISRCDGMIDRLKGRLIGAKAFLTKPFKTETLLAVAKEQVSMKESLEKC